MAECSRITVIDAGAVQILMFYDTVKKELHETIDHLQHHERPLVLSALNVRRRCRDTARLDHNVIARVIMIFQARTRAAKHAAGTPAPPAMHMQRCAVRGGAEPQWPVRAPQRAALRMACNPRRSMASWVTRAQRCLCIPAAGRSAVLSQRWHGDTAVPSGAQAMI